MKSILIVPSCLRSPLVISLLLLFVSSSSLYGLAPRERVIETSDIIRFWEAFDQLSSARTRADSMRVIQSVYIDRASPFFKDFLKARNFTAEEYMSVIAAFPAFWTSIRPLTLQIADRKSEIESVFGQLEAHMPKFKRPDVCFAIGCLRTGGTTSNDLILIGSEIAAADASVNTTGMNDWLQSVLGKTGDIVAMVAHEAMHTQQSGFPVGEFFKLLKHKKLSLANMAIVEGGADFLTKTLLHLNINQAIHAYGDMHECPLWEEFNTQVTKTPFDYSAWLYNGNQSGGRPADLAYYIGYKVCSSFYTLSGDKDQAIKTLLKRGQYKKIYRKAGYKGSC